ncbi:putative tetratricopeptide-like helical domain superfamily [Helianthus annuus]|nr:putative tetratricopeptide-like helical domain superfamily [Helianthus annuus]
MPIKNVVSWTAMLTAYVENGQINNARKLFDEMPERNVVSWNAMITGYMRSPYFIACPSRMSY